MIIAIQNTIGAIRSLLGTVMSGLKMWLPFSSSQQLGEEIIVNGDFSASRPELVTNGDYTNGLTSWSTQIPSGQVVEVVNNKLHIDYDASQTQGSTSAFQAISSFADDKVYNIVLDIESITGTLSVQVGGTVTNFNTSGFGVLSA